MILLIFLTAAFFCARWRALPFTSSRSIFLKILPGRARASAATSVSKLIPCATPTIASGKDMLSGAILALATQHHNSTDQKKSYFDVSYRLLFNIPIDNFGFSTASCEGRIMCPKAAVASKRKG